MSEDRPLLVYRRLMGFMKGSTLRLALVMLSLGLHSGAMLLFPYLMQNLFRDTTQDHHWTSLVPLLGLSLGLMLVINLARYFSDDQLEVVSLRMIERIRNQLVGKLVRLPASHFVQSRAGDAISRVFNDVEVLKAFLQNSFFALGSDLFRTVGAIGMLFFMSWKLASLTLLMGVLGGGVVALSSRLIRRRFHRVQSTLADMTSLLTEQVRAVQTIQAYGATDYEVRRFAEKNGEYFREAVLGNRLHVGTQAVVNFLGAFAVIFFVAFGTGGLSLDGLPGAPGGGLPLDKLVGFTLYAGLLAGPLTRLSRTNFAIQQALAAGRHLFELLDIPDEQVEGTKVLTCPPRGVLRFESVCFHYRPDEPILRGIDLTLHPGEPVAIVGVSGTGKSTLTHLALRFYEPVSGRVMLDGHDIRDLRLGELRRHIGWVGQDPFLFRGTVAENIRYGSWDASQEAIEKAARLACADNFIRELPLGYSARIGERGVDLSGGQRARLALARVILRSPAIVILDEATASLDTETEGNLWKGLAGWMAQRTTVVIAHRLLTVLSCPRIVVLEEGRKVGDGTSEHLQQACPTFSRIFLEQMNLAPRAA